MITTLCFLLFFFGTCLPTGVCLDPAGQSSDVGNMPLAVVSAPEGDRLVLSLNGWRQQGIQVIDAQTGTIMQTISQPSAFFGLAFSNDGQTLYASGGNEDVIYRYSWRDKQATLIDTIVLAQKEPRKDGTRVDTADEDAFNRILWTLLKGSQTYPGIKRMSSQEMARAQ